MTAKHPQEYYELLHLAANHMNNAVKCHLPEGPSKDFMLWILNDSSKHQENYLRMLGVAGSIELELKLFKQVLPSSTLSAMTNYIGLLNAYFGYETLSDNLGVGLAAHKKEDNPHYFTQKQVLLSFNEIMIEKIKGSQKNIYASFQPLLGALNCISVNQQTLLPEQMHAFTRDYATASKSVALQQLEHSFLEILILNVATCLNLLKSLAQNPVYPLLENSLIARYASVSNIINQGHKASLAQLANWGLHSILTIPTLAYCIGALEEVSGHHAFKSVIQSGLLYESMADAALLTRLLNDIGTRLLILDEQERKALYLEFQAFADSADFNSIFSCLDAMSKKEIFFYLLTRIRKDITYGESNICLDTLKANAPVKDALSQFCKSIDYFATLYQAHDEILRNKLDTLSEQLGDEQASKIIYNFVDFHKLKYSMEFETVRGDYAVTTLPPHNTEEGQTGVL